MKKLIIMLLLTITISQLHAQYVKVRLNFPAGVVVSPGGPPPYAGAIWIAPEWRWSSGNYVHVPGYWVKPRYRGAVWVPGHWKMTGHGYKWMHGKWRKR